MNVLKYSEHPDTEENVLQCVVCTTYTGSYVLCFPPYFRVLQLIPPAIYIIPLQHLLHESHRYNYWPQNMLISEM